MRDLSFYKGKKVLITGHTGFKGSWMCSVLDYMGAETIGYALRPSKNQRLFEMLQYSNGVISIEGDIRDLNSLRKVFEIEKPEIVIHMAAQPLVRESYENPVYTYETNVMGTVNVLECVRLTDSVKSFVNVTTDKVYQNREWCWGYREDDRLDGYDPYSNSKSCSELVTHSYEQSFLKERNVAVSTARAGNVIGGGDFAKDRIIPDCVRAAVKKEPIIVRNPYSIRPYQHVLEPVFAYLMLAMKQYEDKSFAGNYNIGPGETDCVNTGALADLFCEKWGEGMSWVNQYDGGPHEAGFLKLDCSKMKSVFGWSPVWHIDEAIEKTVEWYKAYHLETDLNAVMLEQIHEYESQFLRTIG